MKASSLRFCNCSRIGCGSNIRRAVDLISWIVPGAILALIPKCPICFAAYIALWTGIGLSVSAAIYLRVSVMALCIGLILFVATRSAHYMIHKLRFQDRSLAGAPR